MIDEFYKYMYWTNLDIEKIDKIKSVNRTTKRLDEGYAIHEQVKAYHESDKGRLSVFNW